MGSWEGPVPACPVSLSLPGAPPPGPPVPVDGLPVDRKRALPEWKKLDFRPEGNFALSWFTPSSRVSHAVVPGFCMFRVVLFRFDLGLCNKDRKVLALGVVGSCSRPRYKVGAMVMVRESLPSIARSDTACARRSSSSRIASHSGWTFGRAKQPRDASHPGPDQSALSSHGGQSQVHA